MFGTNFTLDLLVGQFANQTILLLGEQKVYDAIETGLKVHEITMAEVFSSFADIRTEGTPGDSRYDIYGGNRIMKGRKVDQIGLVDAQKVRGGYLVGFPLDRTQYAIQWTKDFLEYATGADLAKDFNAARQGNEIDMRTDLLDAIFNPTNRTEIERFYNGIPVQVKALINADGSEMPVGPRGEVFDGSTHTHYLANSTLTQAAVKSLIQTVKEHYERGRVYVYINKADEATYRAMSEFLPFILPTIIPGIENDRASQAGNDMPIDDREIGQIDNAVITVKSWMPSGYSFAVIYGPGIGKIARFRQHKGGMYLAAREESYPLRAEFLEHDYGVGVAERTAGAVLYSAGSSYVAPTLT